MGMIGRWFSDHPQTVGESYFEHQRFAARSGAALLVAGAACLVHALFPALCTTTASRTVGRLYADISSRGNAAPSVVPAPVAREKGWLLRAAPGLALAILGAAGAILAARLWSVPAVFTALIVGAAAAALIPGRSLESGGAFASTSLLRLGVVMMGANIDVELIARLGWPAIALAVAALGATLALGLGLGRLFGLKGRPALLTASSVAICGASATLALASVMPRRSDDERQTTQIIVLVTIVGSAAMLVYPFLARTLGLNSVETGVFLGAALHELAQAAGAGASVSPDVGVMAVAVKLVRVACLAPIGLALALWLQSHGAARGEARPPALPWFLAGFVLVAIARNLGLIPDDAAGLLAQAAQVCLVAAMVGLGLKIAPAKMVQGDRRLILAILAQTALLAGLVLTVLLLAPGLFGGSGSVVR